MAKVLQRLTMAAVLIGGLTALAVQTADAARPERPGSRAARPAARRGFQLFAGNPTANLEVNRVYCGLTDAGEVCTDVTGSPVLGGGSWPRGTPDQYVFNTGLQVAGIIPSNAGFAWAGDTVGAWAIDTRGPAVHMQALTGIFNSLIPDDANNWPTAAYVNDTSLYNAALIGRPTISQQDTWERYWDGSTTLLTGRRHTMGLLVEQRSLAWNFPTGNEDLVYFLFRFTNITAKSSSGVYAGLANYGYSAQDIADIGALGDQFQSSSEAAFNIQIPDGGYTIGNTYVAFTADMDVGDAGNNYATAALPFSLGVTWKSDWLEPLWQFPATIFSAPFASAPGFVGVKYLKSPVNPATNQEFGITIFSTYTNPSAANSLFPDPLNIYQGYRYISGTPGPATGDQPCQYAPARHLCFLGQAPSDQRFMQSSGPFTLAPGQSEVVVVAYLFAPAMATNGSFSLGPYIGNNTLIPGVVPSGDRLVSGLDTLRLIDRAMGWVNHTDANNDLTIDQNEVTVTPGSILDKSLVAQAVFDNKFLLPFAPDAPEFYLIPADNQVTVVWQKSATETTGDPYFVVASDVTSPLYDPNFRQYDVEGYRIWKGRSPSSMELVVQYDYAGTRIFDYTGAFVNGDYNDGQGRYRCAPEIGITSSCPSFPHAIDLVDGGPGYAGAVQVPQGGRVALANGNVLVTLADTAVVGGGSGFPSLTDTDVPFAYVDNSVRNGYRYYYSVTAFDVNSLASGPSSLTSALITKSVTPRAPASTEVQAELTYGVFGDDTVRLNGRTSCTFSIDPATGRFSGPPCPRAADQLAATFAPLVPQLLPGMTLEFKIDSVRSRTTQDFGCTSPNIQGVCGQAFVTFTQGSNSQSFAPQLVLPIWEGFGGTDALLPTTGLGAFRVDADSASAARFGIPAGFAGFNASVAASFNRYIRYSAQEGQMGRRILGNNVTANMFSPGGSRWFDGTNETLDHPTIGIRAGHVAGVDTIYHPLSHIDQDPYTAGNQRGPNPTPQQCYPYAVSMWGREADIELTWGAGGTIQSVRDITNHVDVPYKAVPEGSYGFMKDNNNNGKIDWQDIDHLEGVWQSNDHLGFCYEIGTDPGPGNRATLSATPVIMATSVVDAGPPATAMPTTGNGFGLYIAGEYYIFQNTGAFTAPAAGTKWTLRQYAGIVTATNPGSATPSNYQWTDARISGGATVVGGSPIPPSPMVPGLRVVFSVPSATTARPVTGDDLSRIHTVPDPYYVTNNAEISTNTKILRFVNMPPQAIVRIYSVSGILVNVLAYNDAGLGGELTWNLRNRNNQFVASGVYFYHVETPTGQTRVGRFTVVNYAQ